MENASKALLLAAGTLLGVLIIIVAVRMFSSASGVTQSYHSQEGATEIESFNNRFTKFIGATRGDDDTDTRFATIHDIISLANFAWDYNRKKAINLDVNPIDEPNGHEFIHIQLCKINPINSKVGDTLIENFENYTEQTYQNFIKFGYYAFPDKPDQDNIVIYEIDIETIEYDQVGKIKNIKFYPSTYNEKIKYDSNTMKTINENLQHATNTKKEKSWRK